VLIEFLSLCPLIFLHGAPNPYKSRIIIRCRSPLPFDLIIQNVEIHECISIHSFYSECHTSDSCSFSSVRTHPIPALFPQLTYIPFLLVFHCPQRCASAYQSIFFVLGNSLMYAPAKGKVNVSLSLEHARPDRYRQQDMALLQTSSFP